MCLTKQLVKQLEEPQPKPQVEQENTPQEQIKINHEDGGNLMIKKKKTRRGGKSKRKSNASKNESRCKANKQEQRRENEENCSYEML